MGVFSLTKICESFLENYLLYKFFIESINAGIRFWQPTYAYFFKRCDKKTQKKMLPLFGPKGFQKKNIMSPTGLYLAQHGFYSVWYQSKTNPFKTLSVPTWILWPPVTTQHGRLKMATWPKDFQKKQSCPLRQIISFV